MGGFNKNITRYIFHVFCDNITNGIGGEMGVMRREVEEGEDYIGVQLRRSKVYLLGVTMYLLK